MIAQNCTLKQHWPACPVEVARLTQTTTLDATEIDTRDPLLIERGIRLLDHLVERANRGESVGVGYKQFACCVLGKVFNRPYLPSDTEYVLRLAHRITATTGRKLVDKNGVILKAGMDTFIWQSKPPHKRPSKAFKSTPYREEDWKTAFPDGTRRLLNYQKGRVPHGPSCPPSSGVCPPCSPRVSLKIQHIYR